MSGRERHWLHVFATFAPAGPQVRTLQILAALPRTYRHTIVAMDGCTAAAARVAGDVRLELLPAPPRGTVAVARWARALLQRLQPDLLLTYNFGAIETLFGAWRARFAAVVHHEEGFGAEESDRLLWRRNVLRRLLLRRARAVVVPSRNLERLARATWRQPAARVHYLPNGVDLQRFTPQARRGGGAVVIGNVGALRPVKHQAMLLQALARMRQPARLVLVGDGPDRAACVALRHDLGLDARVTMLGAVADTAPVYREFDVFAMSSRTEQMPIVVLEAMASGLPVAATDVGDVRGMLPASGQRFVVSRDDPAALAAALDALVTDAQLRDALGAENRTHCAREFDAVTCLGRYVELFERSQRL